MELIGSKSLLAKLMATENLTVEHRKVSTASFDVKNRILTIPILEKDLSANLYDLFTGHEVGHALYTPLKGMLKAKEEKINMSVLNVVEDSRIERKVKYKYPGLKHPFYKAYGELLERNFFETDGKDLNEYNLIDRINLHCKAGAALNIKFNEEERELLDAVEETETYEEVIEVAKRIIEYMKKNGEEEIRKTITVKIVGLPGEQGGSNPEENENKTDDEEKDNEEIIVSIDAQGGQPDNSDDSDEESNDTVEASKEEPKENSKPKLSPEIQQAIEQAVQKALEELIESKTDDAQHRNEKTLYDFSGQEYQYVNIPKVDTSFILDHKDLYSMYKNEGYDFDTPGFLKYRRESDKVVSYLVKEFELRKNAEQMKRARTSKTGELNMSKIFSYKFNDDIFKKTTIINGGKSHGLVMFLDWSGSMADHIGNTMKQLYNLAFFCKKVNIPFEVYSFIERPYQAKEFKQDCKKDDLVLSKFGLANILSSRMNSSEMTFACSALYCLSGLRGRYSHQPYWLTMQGTPLNETIIAAMEIVPQFQKKYKLQNVNTVFLTDGEGHRLSQVFLSSNYYDTNRFEYGKSTHVVLRDPVTKQQESYQVDFSSINQTKALIKLLKSRTNSNVIGFYIANGREFGRRMFDFYPETKGDYLKQDKIKEGFRKEKFLVVENSGFDEYYILRTNGLDTDENNKFDEVETSTTKGLVSAFSKYSGSKINNRVILNRFINLIT